MSLYLGGVRKDTDFTLISSDINPDTDNVFDIGTANKRFRSARISQNLTVGGNLTVEGTTITIQSTTLTVGDKNIELASIALPTDALADGGGITLRGTTDKTILWKNATNSWDFNQAIRVGNLQLNGNTISSINANGDILLSPNGNGKVGIGTASPSASLEVAGQIKITGGAPGSGKVLTSDAAGLATWETAAGGGAGGWTDDGTIVRLATATDSVGIGTANPAEKLTISQVVAGAYPDNRERRILERLGW